MAEQSINENEMINQAELIGAIDKILVKKSIARRVSDIQPLKGPVGIISGAEWDKTEDKLTIAKADITAITRKIRTEFTVEAIQDMQSIYGESFYEVLATYISDEIVYKIDNDFLAMVKERAETKDTLTFSGEDYDANLWAVGQSIAIAVNKGTCDLPISDNRSPQAWAIVSSNVASLLAGTLGDSARAGENDNSPSYLGRIASVDYYIDYTHQNNGTDSIIFGIKGNGISKGSTIYSPYMTKWVEAINSETGEPIYFVMDRTGMAINPLDKKYYNGGNGVSGFLGKYNVDLSDLQIFN